MIKAKRVKVPIFPADLLIFLSDEPTKLRYSNKKLIFEEFTNDKYARGGVLCNDTVKGFIECIIFIHALNPDHLMDSTIVHECEHAKDLLLEKWGIENVDTEVNAYLVDWLYTQVHDFVYNTKPPKVRARWKESLE